MFSYKSHIRPVLFAMSKKDPERAHRSVINLLRFLQRSDSALGWVSEKCCVKVRRLQQTFLGLDFPNPVGLAGGVDKNVEAPDAWPALGFGFAEFGTVTRHKQKGNPRPRIFRLEKDEALINRMGFNNEGANDIRRRLIMDMVQRHSAPRFISLGKSKVTPLEEATQDYLYTHEAVSQFFDVITVNVSSPNTPDLRKLQDAELLGNLLEALTSQEKLLAERMGQKAKPILVKLAPDLTWEALDEALQVCSDKGADGLIATNTTVTRPRSLRTKIEESGGLSGKPLQTRALEVVSYIRKRMGKDFLIIGVGGIFNHRDAFRMLLAGANLIQIYTGLIYEGPKLPRDINLGLLILMEAEGLKHIREVKDLWGTSRANIGLVD